MIILIVDDSSITRSLIKRTIVMSGLPVDEILEAGDGAEAIKILATRGADLLITDINMPNMGGVELVQAIRGDRMLRDLPVIVVTTDCSGARRAAMSELGVTGYLSKPFRPEEFRAQLNGVVGGGS